MSPELHEYDYDTISSNISRVQDFGLEALGNWRTFKDDADGTNWDLEQTRYHNKANEIDTNDVHSDGPGASITASTGTNWVDPKFDAAGNMTLGPRPGDEGDANDALVMVYDAWNRKVKVYDDDDADGVADADELIVTYYYDGLNRRIHKAKPRPMDEWEVWSYYYDTFWRVVEEQYDLRAQDPMEDDLLTKSQYVWDIRYIDAVVVRWHDGNDDCDFADANEVLYYCNDANMNVTALVNTSGTVVERYVYDAYGKVTFLDGSWGSRQSSSYGNEILYCGYRRDPETGLYHVRNRYYHPTMGRWITVDPIRHGMNWYEYVMSSPASKRDPTGLACLPIGYKQDRVAKAGIFLIGLGPDEEGEAIELASRLETLSTVSSVASVATSAAKAATLTKDVAIAVGDAIVKEGSINTVTPTPTGIIKAHIALFKKRAVLYDVWVKVERRECVKECLLVQALTFWGPTMTDWKTLKDKWVKCTEGHNNSERRISAYGIDTPPTREEMRQCKARALKELDK